MRYIALLLAFSFSHQFLKPLVVLGDYAVRYQVYVEQLCENRDQVDMHCNGTCQIAQLLQTQEKPEKPLLPQFNFPQDWLNSLVLEWHFSSLFIQAKSHWARVILSFPAPFIGKLSPPPQDFA